MNYHDIKKILAPLGLKISRSPYGYLIVRASDGAEYANFGTISEVENHLHDLYAP